MKKEQTSNVSEYEILIHTKHCYKGEYSTSCKYGDDNCPAKRNESVSVEEAAKNYLIAKYNADFSDNKGVIKGANFWGGFAKDLVEFSNKQKEQDKAIIEELLGYIKSLKIHIHGWSKLDEQAMGYEVAKEGLELISKAEQYINQ